MAHIDLETIFTYHAPTAEQRASLRDIRAAALSFAQVVIDNTPECADQSAAIRKIREAVMTANASIVIDCAPVAPAIEMPPALPPLPPLPQPVNI